MDPRLGIYVSSRVGVPFADRMAMIRDAGFGATCLWWEEEHNEARRLRHLAPDIVRKNGLHLDNIHVPYRWCNALWSSDDDERSAAVERHIAWVHDCRRHEIPLLVMHVTMGTRLPAPNSRGVDSLRRIVEAGEDCGVTVAVENTRSAKHIEALFEAIPSENLGLCFDTSHDFLYGDPPLQLLRDWGHRLVTTHFSDTDGRRDYHWLPGEGIINFKSIAEHFPESYTGCLMLEVVPKSKDEPLEKFLMKARESACLLPQTLGTRKTLRAGGID